MEKVDYKKKDKALYNPKQEPMIVDVPQMSFMMIDGAGNPNTSPSYNEACEIMYSMTYAIKMSPRNGFTIEGYFDFVVPPLEGLWWLNDGSFPENFDPSIRQTKEKFCWTSLMRTPEFVTPEVFEQAKEIVHHKKPELNLNRVRLVNWKEGLCVQIMHIGPFDNENTTVAKLNEFLEHSEYENDITEERRHHEIYLSGFTKVSKEKMKTVLRHPICKK